MPFKIMFQDPNRILGWELTFEGEMWLVRPPPPHAGMFIFPKVFKCVVVIFMDILVHRFLRTGGSGADPFRRAAFRDELNNFQSGHI